MMNLRKLEIFTLVAELGSLSKAAKATGMAQSLVSRHIAQLEEEWGDKLFERTGRGVLLSEFGRRVQPEIQLLLDQMERLHSTVKDAAGVPSGTVHIGVLPSMSRMLIAPLFEDMQKLSPSIRLHFVEGFSGDLDEQLMSGRLDMAIINRYGSSPGRGEDALGQVDTYLVQKYRAEASAAGSIRFKDLAGLPLALPGAPNGLRSILSQHARRLGIDLNIVLEADTLSALKDIALSGCACTILPLLAVAPEVAEKKLTATPISHPAITRTIALAVTRQRPLSKAARLVLGRARKLSVRLLSAQK